MRGNETRVKKDMELALEHLDYIIDHRTAPDFVEVTGQNRLIYWQINMQRN